jgi:peptidoglycan hydrolase CwlO-like protein
VSDHEKVAKMFDIVKKKVSEVNHRLKPLQDQIRKWKTELDKTQTSYKSKVRYILSIYRRI